MLKSIRIAVAMVMSVVGAGIWLMPSFVAAEEVTVAELKTYDAEDGQRYFALSLAPQRSLPMA